MKQALRTAAIMVTVAALFGSARADDRSSSLTAGEWAAQFSVSGGHFVSLRSFDGDIALKRQVSPRTAWRLSVSGSFESDTNSYDHSPPSASLSQELDRTTTSITVLFQRYTNPGAKANFFWGIGPTAGFGKTTQKATNDLGQGAHGDATELNAGARSLIGVEWFVIRPISLHAEYRATAVFTWWKQTYKNLYEGQTVYSNEYRAHQWSAALGGVQFGMSVYF